MNNAVAHHLVTDALALINSFQPIPSSLYTEHDSLWEGILPWLAQISCAGHAPFQLLMYPTTEQFLMQA